MSAAYHYTITCDEPGCKASFTSGRKTAYATRVDARLQGWRHVFNTRVRGGPALSVDKCATHAPAAP